MLSRRSLVKGIGSSFIAPIGAPSSAFANQLLAPPPVEQSCGAEIMYSSVVIPTGLPFPRASLSIIRHRRDLADLGEPYLSVVKKFQASKREWELCRNTPSSRLANPIQEKLA